MRPKLIFKLSVGFIVAPKLKPQPSSFLENIGSSNSYPDDLLSSFTEGMKTKVSGASYLIAMVYPPLFLMKGASGKPLVSI